tara:strand:- start:2028 stop:3200 length:1173 start_codon:yes stop_codon:yes gene_type:complete
MKITTVAINEVIPYARNPRKNEDAITKVSASLQEYGWQQPIVVDAEMVIIAGHTRLEAAKRLKMEKVPIHIADKLTEAQVKAFRIADNRVSQEAEWDMDLLKIELGDLEGLEFDLSLTGFDDDELNALMVEAVEDGLTDDDEVPEAPENPVSVLGDVWTLGNHRLMCGDSSSVDAVDKLMDGKKIDFIVTDPPYGIGIDGQKESKSKNPKHNRKKHEFRGWDTQRPDPSIFNFITSQNCPSVIWGGNYFSDLLPATRGWIYWSKGQDGLTMSDGELAWTTEDKPLRSVTVNRGALRGSVHPTQKPIDVIIYSLDFLQISKNDCVLDLFGGSGSTLIACEKTGRHCRMMELDETYADIIICRWQDFTGKEAVHEETGKTYNQMKAERDGGK